MNDAFRHLHMPPDLAADFLAVFSRFEYALKATIVYARPTANGVDPWWDKFANDIDGEFRAITDKDFISAVDYLLTQPPRKQVLDNNVITFAPQAIDPNQSKAQQTLRMVRTVRNNLFHGGKYSQGNEMEEGRDLRLVTASMTVVLQCARLQNDVWHRYEA